MLLKDWFQFLRTHEEVGSHSVLVVSDDESVVSLIGVALSNNHYNVGAAANLAETIKILDAAPPDVLICDFKTPEIQGKQILETARLRLGKSRMPAVLFLRDTQEDEIVAHNIGADDLIRKPFESDMLLECVARLVTARASARG
jgi:DNA-binding response OmpR family regulator